MAGPTDIINTLIDKLAVKSDCSNYKKLPDLGFVVGDHILNLKPEDYVDKGDDGCSVALMTLDIPPPKGPLFIFGDPFLRRFVTIYDRNEPPRVGFAVANHGGENPADIISAVGGGSGNVGAAPSGNANINSRTLHLQGGLMTGDSAAGASDDATPAPREMSSSDASMNSSATCTAVPPRSFCTSSTAAPPRSTILSAAALSCWRAATCRHVSPFLSRSSSASAGIFSSSSSATSACPRVSATCRAVSPSSFC